MASAADQKGDAVASIPATLERLRQYFGTHVTKSYAWRKAQLEAMLRMIEENEKAWTDALKADLSKPYFEASFTEVVLSITELRSTLKDLAEWMKPQKAPTPVALLPGSSYVLYEPYGVALIIGAFNYPIMLTIMPLAAAVSAGNIAVIKPSELSPATSKLIAQLIPKYMDQKAFAVVEGSIPETTALLAQKWDYIFFTGSERVGKVVMKAAAEHLTPLTLELGGKSPTIVCRDADIALAARRIMWGKVVNSGQSCIAPDYVFVHKSVKAAFLDACAKQIQSFYPAAKAQGAAGSGSGSGSGSSAVAANSDFGRIVNVQHTQRLAGLLDAHKADVVAGGQYDVNARFVAPTVLRDVKLDSPIMASEIFGPILPVVDFDDIEHVITHINANPKPLALYLFTSDEKTISNVTSKTSSGGVSINDVMMHFANGLLPFGGVGSSGQGAYHHVHGFRTFSHAKSVLHKSRWLDAPIRYPPYSDLNYRLFRYAAEIYRVNSDSFKRVFWSVMLPVIIGAAAHHTGLTFSFRSRL